MEHASESPHGFPRALLSQPPEARLHYFETKVVAHQRLKEVHASLLQALRYPAGVSLILVVGPTGVGKTTLRRRIERQLLEDAQASPTCSPGHIPVVGLEVPSPDGRTFNWKDYYSRALLALDEPFIADKITYEVCNMHRDEQGRLILGRSLTIPDLRRALEKTLLHRQPRAFLVDEAQHFRKLASGRRLLDQMDNLKSLASMTQTVHVLVGTYELLGLTNLSAQLSRRSLELHFPRYHADKTEEFQEFRKLLRTLQKHLPLSQEPDLESHADECYEQCLGCAGMLKTWLNRALAAALEQQAKTITPALWKRHASPRSKLVQMIREIREGEQALAEDEAHRQELRTLLHLPATAPLEQDATVGQEVPPSRGSILVGHRAPHRDPVGREN